MKWIFTFRENPPKEKIGGKAFALAALRQKDLNVPNAFFITADAYRYFVEQNSLDQQINLELGKKDFSNMRWEELWDIALRLRNRFSKGDIPEDLLFEISQTIEDMFPQTPVGVRSSSLAEDSSQTSFAGLHESYINLVGKKEIIQHIKLVWASLWSDRALLYRRELGLDPFESAMGVVVQEMVFGDSSGVSFSMNPVNPKQGSVEAVYGLNQGLVDGTIEPDHWELDRANSQIVEHRPAKRTKALKAQKQGVAAQALNKIQQKIPPLNDQEVQEVYDFSRQMEKIFQSPQDMEWTIRLKQIYILQSRSITTITDEHDERKRYLSLKRSLDNLKSLKLVIEKQLIPDMEAQAKKLNKFYLTQLTDQDLVREIKKRQEIVRQRVGDYWEYCIPFAHGMRLFGQVYNDRMNPNDPYEFMKLLENSGLVSVKRNQRLSQIGKSIRQKKEIALALERNEDFDQWPEFTDLLDEFIESYGKTSWGGLNMGMTRQKLARLAAKFETPKDTKSKPNQGRMRKVFLESFEPEQREEAQDILEIGIASYRLRDDDNIFLGKVEGELTRALDEGFIRLEEKWGKLDHRPGPEEICKALTNQIKPQISSIKDQKTKPTTSLKEKPRQLVGQPASPGIAVGRARIVSTPQDLYDFKKNEILICDAIDPNMTLVVPLAAGIVERRGGMLIHGAIIAREQNIPCVTGVPEAASLIKTGESVCVDGYLGIVIVGENSLKKSLEKE
ncbi:PEP/pyruvate-binding domain-containing protein [Dethiosulfatarculus sandiegensis]|uniref:Phosphoenolpyruvate synthase n=1 Tax=Dethiosulfatarculus sandiegensis TaxID=1429043 RepID=A0A0D2JUC6_9BACT|nr:PEP/pyruvate-binding domain-containing protein [Dethiosulfatarculus sandiegensis]KIX13085.1 hypothetical protein X474_16095 [Dethiosulfatarculus sandiegensis]